MRSLSVQTTKIEGLRVIYTGRPKKSRYGFSTAQVLYKKESIQVACSITARERKMRVFHSFMHMVLADLGSICTAGFNAILGSSMNLNCFSILWSHSFHIHKKIYKDELTWSGHTKIMHPYFDRYGKYPTAKAHHGWSYGRHFSSENKKGLNEFFNPFQQ